LAGLTLMVAFPIEAFAKDPVFVVTKSIVDKSSVTLDPTVGYILLRAAQPMSLHLMKIANADDQAAYDKMRAEALAKERKRYPGRVGAYRQDLATYEVLKEANGRAKKPEPPVEPTEENFVYPAFGMSAGASIGPLNRFSKGEDGRSVYLQSITPGSYRIYGLMAVMPGAPVAGTCFCMGSVKFAVHAGEIVDLGDLEADGKLNPSVSGSEIDVRLKGWTLRPADYRAVGKLPNYFGVTLSRIPAMTDVIAYDRDRIVDLKTEGAEISTEKSAIAPAAPAS
jgi:hypothetical protein